MCFANPARVGVASASRIAHGIAIEARMRPGAATTVAPRFRGGAKRCQALRVVLLPALEAETRAQQAGRDVGGDQRRLDRKCPRAAHRVDEARRPSAAIAGQPARSEYRGGEILLERRRALPAAIAAPVQAVAREIDGDRDGDFALDMHIDANVGAARSTDGRRPGLLAELIHDRVLHPLRAELRVRDAGHAAREIDGQRAVDIHVRRPVDLAQPRIELVRIRDRKAADLPQHAQADA